MNIGTRIMVNDDDGPRAGTVAGFGHCLSTGHYDDDDRWVAPTMQPMLLVRLDRGFMSPDRHTFVDVLVVHPSNAIAIITRTITEGADT